MELQIIIEFNPGVPREAAQKLAPKLEEGFCAELIKVPGAATAIKDVRVEVV